MKTGKKWRRLDNSAQIFPIISNKKFSTVFRFSTILKEEIVPEILKQALDLTLKKFVFFKVRLRRGLFWYFLEENFKEPIIEEEKNYPCKYIDSNLNNQYLFKVTYFKNKINLEVFHSLTDGNSAIRFMKELTYSYIELAHPNSFPISFRNQGMSQERKIENNTEDSYLKNYNKKLKRTEKTKKAYCLKGKNLPLGATGTIHGWIEIDKLRELCKQKQVTVTQYLTAVLIQAIYQENVKIHPSSKPIKICIPVNLKKYFSSTTMTNFFSYITLQAQTNKTNFQNFDSILDVVKQEFEKRLTEEEINKTMSANVKLGMNLFIRLIPLFIKKFTVKMSYIEIRKYTTTTFSNIGRIAIMPEYKQYIESFLFLIAPEQVERIKCSACSYENYLIFTFTSIMDQTDIERNFFNHFREKGIKVKIESNGVYGTLS